MGYPTKLLGEHEKIEFETKPHWRALIFPVVVLLLTAGLGGYLLGKAGSLGDDGSSTRLASRWIVGLGILFVLVVWVIRPFVFWFTTQYVFTNRRIIIRTGFIAKRGRDMPLSRVNDVSFSHTVFERIINCGTLTIESAGEHGQLVIAMVPNVEIVQRDVYRLHDEDEARRTGRLEDGT